MSRAEVAEAVSPAQAAPSLAEQIAAASARRDAIDHKDHLLSSLDLSHLSQEEADRRRSDTQRQLDALRDKRHQVDADIRDLNSQALAAAEAARAAKLAPPAAEGEAAIAAELAELRGRLDDARKQAADLEAERPQHALAAARGGNKAIAALGELVREVAKCNRTASDLESAIGQLERQLQDVRRAATVQHADRQLAEARAIADDIVTESERADRLLAEAGQALARRRELLSAIAKTGCTPVTVFNIMANKMAVTRALVAAGIAQHAEIGQVTSGAPLAGLCHALAVHRPEVKVRVA